MARLSGHPNHHIAVQSDNRSIHLDLVIVEQAKRSRWWPSRSAACCRSPASMVGPFTFLDHMGPALSNPVGNRRAAHPQHRAFYLTTFSTAKSTTTTTWALVKITSGPGSWNWNDRGAPNRASARTDPSLRPERRPYAWCKHWVACRTKTRTCAGFAHHAVDALAECPNTCVVGAPPERVGQRTGEANACEPSRSPLFYLPQMLEHGAMLALPGRSR